MRRTAAAFLLAANAAAAAGPAPPPRQDAKSAPAADSAGAAAPQWLRYDADTGGRIVASLYSLPSRLIPADAARAFLRGVRSVAPRRTILALVDDQQERALRADAHALGVRLLTASRGDYSPWPRDPFSLVHDATGRVVIVLRPNLQRGREADAEMGNELARQLPRDLAKAWGGAPRIARATVPFHNGQVLLTPGAAWVTLHTLEPHILSILGLERVPIAEFSSAAGVERYLRAAQLAAGGLARLYHRPVRFVHPLPEKGSAEERYAAMFLLAGGAGFDLDSIVTLLPGKSKPQALVGDVAAGASLVAALPAADLEPLRGGFALAAPSAELPRLLAAAQGERRAAALGAFLDLVATHLAANGFEVRRLPLLLVPTRLLTEADPNGSPDFVLGWNNVVVESAGGQTRAEGFASLLAAGDARAREVFAAAGSALDLFPPLVDSVILGGGYRCASNQLKTNE